MLLHKKAFVCLDKIICNMYVFLFYFQEMKLSGSLWLTSMAPKLAWSWTSTRSDAKTDFWFKWDSCERTTI